MDFTEILCGNAFNFFHMLLSIKYSNSDFSWIFVPVICILVVIEFLLIQTRFRANKNGLMKFENIIENSKYGCWIVVLLPMIIYYYQSYSDFNILIIGSIGGLAIHCYLNKIYFESAIAMSLCAFIVLTIDNYSGLSNLFYPILLSLILSKVLPAFFIDTFSLGESIMLAQIVCLFMLKSLYFSIFFICYLALTRISSLPMKSVQFNFAITLSFGLLFCLLSILYFSKNVFNDIHCLLIPLVSLKNMLLVICWLVLLVICVKVVFFVKQNATKSGSNHVENGKFSKEKIMHMRKIFHFGASIVFGSGLMFEAKDLLIVCSTSLLIAMLLMEYIRQKQIGVIGKQLQLILKPFFDKRDFGALILSPIGLLCGLSLPIWISNLYQDKYSNCESFWLYSGVITVGIGDSFAALIGRKWGRHYWNRQTKTRTIEGSLGCFLSQLLTCAFIFKFLNIPLSGQFAQKVLIATITTTFIEAHSDQMDNFILPLVFCSFR